MTVVANAEHRSAREKKSPVRLVLIPVRFLGQQESVACVIRAERYDGEMVNSAHRAPRISSACQGSASPAPPSPPPSQPAARYRQPAGRKLPPPLKYR